MKRDADNEWLHVVDCDDADCVGCSDAAEMEQMRDELLTLRARITALESAQQWQPIATAPKDGTRVLLSVLYRECPTVGYWWEDFNKWREPGSWIEPTHWMPLPEAPK